MRLDLAANYGGTRRPFSQHSMATEKQIAANRANSKRSTGPKTKIGRLKSCRNALRHGLSCASPMNAIEVETIAQALAQTELELVRICRVRGQMLASLLQCCIPIRSSAWPRLTAMSIPHLQSVSARVWACMQS